jgi:hypothetical protein
MGGTVVQPRRYASFLESVTEVGFCPHGETGAFLIATSRTKSRCLSTRSRWRFLRGSMSARSSGICTSICRRVRFATAFADRQTPQHLGGGSRMRRRGELSAAAIERRRSRN